MSRTKNANIDEQWLRRVIRSHPSNSSSDADDLVQIGRLVLWRAKRLYGDVSRGAARTFVDRALRQHAQRAARRPTTVSLDVLMAPTEEGNLGWDVADPEAMDPAQLVSVTALRQWFDARIAELPVLDREVVRLRYGWEDGQEYSLREVAAALGVTMWRVRESLAHVHRVLRAACAREGWAPEELLKDLQRTTP